jgi:hypothetical protein
MVVNMFEQGQVRRIFIRYQTIVSTRQNILVDGDTLWFDDIVSKVSYQKKDSRQYHRREPFSLQILHATSYNPALLNLMEIFFSLAKFPDRISRNRRKIIN